MTCGTCTHHWQRWRDALEHWINDWNSDPHWHQLREAIPPAYTEFIGGQLLAHLEAAA